MTDNPEPAPKPKRKRKTKAEREAQQQVEAAADAEAAAKPIDPVIWIILGALILFVAFWTWLDPVTFADSGQASSWSVIQLVPLLMIRIFGRTLAILILTALGGIPLVWGIIGWLRKRSGNANKP